MKKPSGLRETAILMALFNPIWYLFFDPSDAGFALEVIGYTLIVIVSYVVIAYYWKGSNWARILVIITSIVALLNLALLGEVSTPEKGVIVAEAALGIFLLVWLNMRHVRAFFRGQNPN